MLEDKIPQNATGLMLEDKMPQNATGLMPEDKIPQNGNRKMVQQGLDLRLGLRLGVSQCSFRGNLVAFF